ncbi:MAG: LacI family DNA-binding transcriptional regulator [Candidatus Sumerlaeota bacterium]|nr:LacI family DNA-binding transcriptional regulator [Candidatus Sumerlaeota bacterium]
MAKYTIRDIARLAGVSRSTVSLVLNNSPSVNPRTRDRVLKVIEEAQYRPSAQARGLVQQRARALALIIPETDEVFRNFYLADTIAGILETITPRGYKLVIEPATHEFIAQQGYDNLLQERRVDGALIAGARINEDFVLRMRDASYPICLINSATEGVVSVSADNTGGARMAARHFAAMGHKDVAYIRGSDHWAPSRDRHAGFMEGMEEYGLAIPPERCAFGNFTDLSGYEACGRLLRQCHHPPRALFAANDMMALGAIRRLRAAGLRVPEDVAVIGADDILLASYSSPTLTTIRQSLAMLGRAAAEILLGRIEGVNPEAEKCKTFPAPLIIRESCGAQSRNT